MLRLCPMKLSFLVLLTLSACRQTEALPALTINEGAPITTDAERYDPTPAGYGYVNYVIGYSYTNLSNTSIFLQPCNIAPPPPDFYLEHYDGRVWAYNYAPLCRGGGPGVNLPETEVRPGEKVTGTVTVSASPSPDSYPAIGKDFTVGVSRLVFDITASATGDPLPLERRVSNAFWLEAPQ